MINENNRTYYGQYSLEYWKKAILSKNIVLPPYQRNFVWEKEKVINLMKAFGEGQFVPPVTIGAFGKGINHKGRSENLVLDGQQRLTSILLAYLGIFPKKESALRKADEEQSSKMDSAEYVMEKRWTFNEVLNLGNSVDEIVTNALASGDYEELKTNLTREDFPRLFMGFSYLVPDQGGKKFEKPEEALASQQRFFSSVFRAINSEGVSLQGLDTREALYFLGDWLTDVFKPDFIKQIKLRGTPTVDFIKYLAFIADKYNDKQNKRNDWAKGTSGTAQKMEKYYEEFIYMMCQLEKSETFYNLAEIGKEALLGRMLTLQRFLGDLGLYDKEFASVIDLDMYLFGAVEVVLFDGLEYADAQPKMRRGSYSERSGRGDILGEPIHPDFIGPLKDEIETAIKAFRNDTKHTHDPNRLASTRERIQKSSEIFKDYYNVR